MSGSIPPIGSSSLPAGQTDDQVFGAILQNVLETEALLMAISDPALKAIEKMRQDRKLLTGM
jgi:hypothetical protein